jgi:hypothetical protein
MLALIACGGGGGSTDIEGTIVFADRTDLEISRFINAAGGVEMFSAMNAVDQFGDTFDADPLCPTIAIDGDTATITGGCTRSTDQMMIAGSASVTNPFSWDQIEYNFGDDTHYEMNGFAITFSTFTTTYNGFADRPDFQTYDADVTVDQMGAALRSDVHYHANSNGTSISMSGSGLELIGVGGATASGHVNASDIESATQDYTLKGVDTLTVHAASGCVAWSIEGTDRGMTCP